MFADHPPTQLSDVLLSGFLPRDPGFPCDARHALYTLQAHGPRGARDALHAAGAVGTLDAFRAQLPSTARLSFGSDGATGTQFTFIPREAIGTRDTRLAFRPCGSSRAPVAHDASETLGAWQARLPYAAFPALEASDARGPGRALWAQSPR